MKIEEIEVTKGEFGAFIGVNNNAVTRMVKAGLPVLDNKKVNLQQATAWFIAQQKSEKSQTQQDARTKLIEAQTKRIKLQILEKRGDLVEIEQVKQEITKLIETLKQRINSLITKLPPKLEGKGQVQIAEILKADVKKTLGDL